MLKKCNLIHTHMGIHILRLFKKTRNFSEQKWLFAGAPKGVLEKK